MMFGKKKELAEGTEVVEKVKKEKKVKAPKTKEQKKKLRKRIVIGGVVVVVLALTVLPKLFAKDILPVVSVKTVALGDVAETVDTSGYIRTQEEKTYFSPVGATVDSLNVSVGDTVEKGQVLLTYDAGELETMEKEASLNASASNYGYQDSIKKSNENATDYVDSSKQVEDLEVKVDDYKERMGDYGAVSSDLESQVVAAAEVVKAAESAKQAAEQKIADNENLIKAEQEKDNDTDPNTNADQKQITEWTNEITVLKGQLPGLQTAIDEAESKWQSVHQEQKKFEDKYNDAKEKYEEYTEDLTEQKSKKSSSEAAKLSEDAKKQLQANNNLANLTAQNTKEDVAEGKAGIAADFNGVVTKVSAVQGGPVVKGGELFTVSSTEQVAVELSISKYDLEKMAVGQEADVTIVGKNYTGTVTKLSKVASKNEKGTPVVAAEVQINEPDSDIYLGMEAKVSVKGAHAEQVLVVPAEAINTGKDGDFCYVVVNGVVETRNVETGISSGEYVEIKSGLEEGDQVITNLTPGVEAGMQVTAQEV